MSAAAVLMLSVATAATDDADAVMCSAGHGCIIAVLEPRAAGLADPAQCCISRPPVRQPLFHTPDAVGRLSQRRMRPGRNSTDNNE